MNNGRFQILLRRRQIQAEYPPGSGLVVNVVVSCDPLTGFAQYLPGNVDNTTPFEGITPVDTWYDFSGLTKDSGGVSAIEPDFKLSFTWDKTNSGDSNNSSVSQDGSNYDKGITSDFTFFDSAYRFIYNWLILTECQILNCVEVKIIDLIARSLNPDPAGNYRLFEIKSDNLDYAPVDEPCQFHVKLREQDNNWHCIHKTVIYDNWQNWFNATGTSTKDHPCFLTCIEPRPRLVQSARMALMLFYHSSLVVTVVDFITGQLDLKDDARRIMNANRFVDAPLVRTYIENVAGRCGLSMDTIFDQGKEWQNLCLYYPQAGDMYENDDNTIASPSLAYNYGNRWLITMADLFDKLKVVFAAEWYVTPLNTIVFKYTKDLINLDPIYDFTASGAAPIYNLRYTFNGDKKPAYGSYEYQDDGSDLASQEISTLYNDIIDYDGPAFNPMLEGEKVKNFEFASTGFVRDGRSKDYMKLLINDGKIGALTLVVAVAVINIALAGGVLSAGAAVILAAFLALWIGEILIRTTDLKNEFVDGPDYTGAVRLTAEQTLVPRLLLWDGVSEQRAKVVQRVGLPIPNPYYNPLLTPYNVKNKIQTDNPTGIVFNYPLYFDGDFYGNMYDKYHDVIDNPMKSLETHQEANWDIDLCEDMLNLFGVFQNQYAVIGKVMKIEERDNYDVFARIGNFSVDYDSGLIHVKGTILRRRANVGVDDPNNPGNIPVVVPEETSGPIVNPDDLCLKWINNGTDAANVDYRDCNGMHVMGQIINPGESFCAFEIYSYAGGNIVSTDFCAESGTSSTSSSENCVPKYYKANLSQSDTSDPIATVYENTIGDIIWTRDSTGSYFGTLAGAFPEGLVWWQLNNPLVEGMSIGAGLLEGRINRVDENTLLLVTRNVSPVDDLADNILNNFSLEIWVYCPGPAPCTAVGFEFDSMPNSVIEQNYNFENNLTGTAPFTQGATTKPDWLDIVIADNGDGTFRLDFSTNRELTTDDEGDITISVEVINCAGPQTFAATFNLGHVGSQQLGWIIDTGLDTLVFEPRFTLLSSGEHGWVNWGDGSPFEEFTFSGTGSQHAPAHTYPSAATWNPVFYFDHDWITDVDLTAAYVSNGYRVGISSLGGSGLSHIIGLHLTNIEGDLRSVIDGSIFSTVGLIELYNDIGTTLTYSGTTFVLTNLLICDIALGNAPVGFINDILVALDANGHTGGSVSAQQSLSPAPPSGAGATAKANLISKGWTVNTD